MADSGLANQALLNKIDKLRELNIESIELPQLVVVGDQSSGKSSVLESLTGFAFPRSPSLCTRYVTQISCRRDAVTKLTISIIPAPGSKVNKRVELEATGLSADNLVDVMEKANRIMGIRQNFSDYEDGLQTFSDDVLKVEITGPDQQHLTVIDVPGIFRVSEPPFTTDSDMTLVRNMVESYMKNSRTIILAVLPSNIDISTQEILKMAEVADPEGIRTMGVLTKPDLATELLTKKAIKDLVLGRRNLLRLGYCLVKNRSADDQESTIEDRLSQERDFFRDPAWKELATTGRCGIESLKTRLSDLLMHISKNDFPGLRNDINSQLDGCRKELEQLGVSRTDQSSQRVYLGELASRFQAVTQCALNGSYESDPIFANAPHLKLITEITLRNEKFAEVLCKKGHKRDMLEDAQEKEDGSESEPCMAEDAASFEKLRSQYPSLHHILHWVEYECPSPIDANDNSIIEHINEVYQQNRGPDLGTFSGSILSATFREQSEKWELLVLSHVSRCICIVHNYIWQLLLNICPDQQVRDQLWEMVLIEKLCKAYSRAIKQARFLLRIECKGRPSTFNRHFNSEVQEKRYRRLTAAVDAINELKSEDNDAHVVPISSLHNLVIDKNNVEQMQEDILDVLTSYYHVSSRRFVDVVCMQAVGHFLLESDRGPLKIFSPSLVMGFDDGQLESIAGEDTFTKNRRAELELAERNLEAATRVLKG